LRDFVVAHAELATPNEEDKELVAAYNAAVKALKEFRDAHMTTVSLCIISPAVKARKVQAKMTARDEKDGEGEGKPLKGTGGKDWCGSSGVRDQRKNGKNAILLC
jgi:indoleamine 2,3-dioxygenase